MKKLIIFTEQKVNKVISMITEDVNLDYYHTSDFHDVFFLLFRQWITEKLGEDVKKYPISYLLRKYGKEFEKDMDASFTDYGDDDDDEINYDSWRMERVAKELIQKGKHSLPSLNTQEKFTEKYAKMLNHFIEALDLPDFVTATFTEKQPNRVKVTFNVNFPAMIKSQEYRNLSSHSLLYKLKSYLEGYVGVKFGNPNYGEVEMEDEKLNYYGLDEWTKNVLNKKIKKDIKAMAPPNTIHSIQFSVGAGKGTLKIVFRDRFWMSGKREVVDKVKEYLKGEGYSDKVLQVTY